MGDPCPNCGARDVPLYHHCCPDRESALHCGRFHEARPQDVKYHASHDCVCRDEEDEEVYPSGIERLRRAHAEALRGRDEARNQAVCIGRVALEQITDLTAERNEARDAFVDARLTGLDACEQLRAELAAAKRERDLLTARAGWTSRDVDVLIESTLAMERTPDVTFSYGIFSGEYRSVRAGEVARAIRAVLDVGQRVSGQYKLAVEERDAALARLNAIAAARDAYREVERESEAASRAHDDLPNDANTSRWMATNTAAVEALKVLLAVLGDCCGDTVVSVYDEVYEARADRDATREELARVRGHLAQAEAESRERYADARNAWAELKEVRAQLGTALLERDAARAGVPLNLPSHDRLDEVLGPVPDEESDHAPAAIHFDAETLRAILANDDEFH